MAVHLSDLFEFAWIHPWEQNLQLAGMKSLEIEAQWTPTRGLHQSMEDKLMYTPAMQNWVIEVHQYFMGQILLIYIYSRWPELLKIFM